MADIFISYAGEDRPLGQDLQDRLAARGFTVWWDYELLGGQRFRDVIGRELKTAGCVLVIWTPRSVRSHFVQDEAEHARRLGKLIPLMSADLDRAQIPLGFGQLHTLRLDATEQIVRTASGFVRPARATSPACQARLVEVAKRIELELGKKSAHPAQSTRQAPLAG